MKINEVKQGNVLILELDGKLHGSTSSDFQKKILGVIEQNNRKVVVDLAQLQRVDSLGLRVFIMAANAMRANGGRLILCSMPPLVKEVFDIAGFLSFFTLCDTRQNALMALA